MRRPSPMNPLFLICLFLLCGLAGTVWAAESTQTADVVLPVAAAEEAVTVEIDEALDVAEWNGPAAPLMEALQSEMESGSDCTSSPGSCSSNGECWSYCRALTGEIGFCSPLYNCCVCLAF